MEYTYKELLSMYKSGNFKSLVPEEVIQALEIMDVLGDDVAYFGFQGCFLYSEKDVVESKGLLN